MVTLSFMSTPNTPSDAEILMTFMQNTEAYGLSHVANVSAAEGLLGKAWAQDQMAQLEMLAKGNGELMSISYQILTEKGRLPLVQFGPHIGKWVGIEALPSTNIYEIHASYQGGNRIHRIGHISLLDPVQPIESRDYRQPSSVTRPSVPVYMSLGSSIFNRRSPNILNI